jgi:large subunit ribosomal protein L4
MPAKMRRLALRCALSQRLREDGIRLVDNLAFDAPKTKQTVAMLQALNVDSAALVITPDLDRNVYLSTRNIPKTATTFVGQLNVFDIVRHAVVIMPVEAARRLEQKLQPATKSENPSEA